MFDAEMELGQAPIMSSRHNTDGLTEAQRNLQLTDDNRPPLFKFVFTGGPCGGKTTALARVFSYLRERNFEVISCPEAYTLLNSNGMSDDFFTTEGIDSVIQGVVLDTQLSLEDGVERVLRARGKPSVILCDRGTMDGRIFVSDQDFQKVMDDRNTNLVELRDNRYDACFHMVTAADGAEAYYTLANNRVRRESKEEALANDKRTQTVWTGHPHLYVLDNSTDFEGKLTRLVDIISKIVGLPSNLKRRSAKFLLKNPPDFYKFPSDIEYQVFEVEKVYLAGSTFTRKDECKGEYRFIRRRTSIDVHHGSKRGGSTYQLTWVRQAENGEMIKQKRIITAREYAAAYETRDRKRHIVLQRRISFLYEKQSFNVHVYEAPVSDVCVLHAQVEAKKSQHEIKLPRFLEVDRLLEPNGEDERKYGAYQISLKEKQQL